ncbi:teichoic acid biosynthesis protein C [Streptomyces sp. NPDC005438]|uniref:phage baseplate protein n=1 Tax=Streptomyces sp. NPDC005438 TaxID=3156880 RepID=UPI0033BE7DDA
MISRRSFALGGVLGLAAGGVGARIALAGPDGPAALAVPEGAIDLTHSAEQHIRGKTLYHATVMQSFSFDKDGKELYAAQLMQGGVQLDDESGPLTGTERAKRGDMCVTRLDPSTGEVRDHMFLRGFGHGASLGVEREGEDTYLWVEADANPDSGYGRGVARVRYAKGTVLDCDADSVTVHHPVSGSTSNRPTVDPVAGTLLVHYRVSGGDRRYRLMRLVDVKAGDYKALHDVAVAGVSEDEVFQGCAVLGDYAYGMTGTAYTGESGANPPSKRGNCYLTCVHLPTGKLSQREWTQAAYSLDYREPEGLAIWHTDTPRLCLGFASGAEGSRKYTIYYKPG